MRTVDLPEALPDGARFLHIGMPKTGTTSLQGALNRSRDRLEELGVHNVGRGRHEMRTALVAAGTLPDYTPDASVWQTRWDELSEEFRTSAARITFWSSESLSQAPPARIRDIADRVGADTHIVLTLRPLAPLLVSQWQEVLRRRGTETLEEWLQKHFDSVQPGGAVSVEWERVMPQIHRFSIRRVIDQWGSVFGEDKLLFVVPDADRQRNFRVFESLMGVPEMLDPPAIDNASLPYPEAEMLRHFNRAYTERGADHPTWMMTVGQLARPGLRRLTSLTTPHPIRAPRWVAERCNEYTADWIEALEASGATVVGDVADLVTEPTDFPEEVAVPTEVDVEMAGRLMDVGFASAIEFGEEQRASLRTDLAQYDAKELLDEIRRRARGRVRRTFRR